MKRIVNAKINNFFIWYYISATLRSSFKAEFIITPIKKLVIIDINLSLGNLKYKISNPIIIGKNNDISIKR